MLISNPEETVKTVWIFVKILNIRTYLFQLKATEGNNNGFIYHGAGTSLTDGSLTNYGGVIFGYNESEVLLWRPADSNTNGYIWYRGGDLGGGDYPQTSSTAEVTVDILRTVTSIGNSLCSNVSHYKLPLHLKGSVVNKLTLRSA